MKFKKVIPMAMAAILVASCKVPQNVTYFQDLKDGQVDQIFKTDGIKLKEGDKISIVVKTSNNTISSLYNMPMITEYVGQDAKYSNANGRLLGYTIDRYGNIDFPEVGKLHVTGLTREQLAEHVKQALIDKKLVKDAIVIVEFMNLHYAVMGEVKKPGQFSFGRDKVNLMEALSEAGDLTLYGRRDSVFVYREVNGKREVYAVNLLNGKELIESPVYYLQQNDIVYVTPNDYQKRMSTSTGNQFQTPSFWLSVTSVLTSVAVLLTKL